MMLSYNDSPLNNFPSDYNQIALKEKKQHRLRPTIRIRKPSTFYFFCGEGGEKNLESCEKPQALDWATENSISCPPPLKHFIFHSFWRTGRFVFLFNEEYRHVVCFLERGVDSYRGWDSARTRRTQRNCGMRRLGRRSSKQSHDGWNAALFRKQTISLTK